MARAANSAKPATPNLAALIGAAPEPPPRATKDRKSLTTGVDGLETYGALKKVHKELDEGFLETYGAPIKAAMLDYFVRNGLVLGRTPPNYKGEDGKVTASLQLRRKDARTVLKPEQVQMFLDLDIPVDHQIDAPHTYRVKPAVYQEKPELVQEMLECLHKAGFAVGELFEEQHERARDIVAIDTVDKLFEQAKKARETNPQTNSFNDDRIRELLECCAGLTIRADWNGTFPEAFEITRKILAPTPAEREAQAKEAAEKAAAAAAANPAGTIKPVTPKDNLMAALKGSLAEVSGGVYSAPQQQPKRRSRA